MPTVDGKVDFSAISRKVASYDFRVPASYKKGKIKFIFVTGGVLSGIGKGIATASIAALLKSRGYRVEPIKIDGYVNVDAGTMNPVEHGEVFVLDDGTECDMDLGNYERFLNIDLRNENNMTTGKVMKLVIDKERKGEYLGKTVQLIPHVTGEIKNWIRSSALRAKADICIIEVGGTVGDIESMIFLEAARELLTEEGHENCAFVHVTLVPVVTGADEQKSKPTQQSVRLLMETGIQPDILVCRAKTPLSEKVKEKIALFSNVKKEHVISDHDLRTTYEAPILFEQEGLVKALEDVLCLKERKKDMMEWRKFVGNLLNPKHEIAVAITGKYTELKDSYVSIMEALQHASAKHKTKINLEWIETTNVDYAKAKSLLKNVDGIIVPGGFGSRGIEGKINCIRVAREKNIPFLGLCLGLQMAVVEYARNVLGLRGANSTEFDPKTPYPVVDFLPEQKKIMGLGGTMRLGAWPAVLKKGSLVAKLYGKSSVFERHRHRWEVNPKYVERLEKAGLVFSGKSPNGILMEFLELPKKKYFVATQSHPEFKSRPLAPAPLFDGFVKACLN